MISFKVFKERIRYFRDVVRRRLAILLFDKSSVRPPLNPNSIKHIVILRWDGKIGDAIISSFVIRELKKYRPDITITIIGTALLKELYLNHFHADKYITCNKRPKYIELIKITHQLSSVDLVVHLNYFMKMKDIFFLRIIDSSYYYGTDRDVKLINIHANSSGHICNVYSNLLRFLNVNDFDRSYIIPLVPGISSRLESLVKPIVKNHKLLAFNPYGSSSSRTFTKELSTQLIKELLKIDNDIFIVILHPPDKKNEAREITRSIDDSRVFYDSDSKTIFDSIEMIRYANIVITVDTSLVHVASGLKKRTIAIYKNADSLEEWGPNSNLAEIILPIPGADAGDVNRVNVSDILAKLEPMLMC